MALCWGKTEQEWLQAMMETVTESFQYGGRRPGQLTGKGMCLPVLVSVPVSRTPKSISSLETFWVLPAEPFVSPGHYRGKHCYIVGNWQALCEPVWADRQHHLAPGSCGRITFSWESLLVHALKGTGLCARCLTASKCSRKESAIPRAKSKHSI